MYKNDGWHDVMCDDLLMRELRANDPTAEPMDREKAGLVFYNDEISEAGRTIAARTVMSTVSKADANHKARMIESRP